MAMYKTYRRSNEFDQPKPEVITHEWCVSATGQPMHDIAFPDNEEGCRAANNFAMHLNTAYERGFAKAQNTIREALGLEQL